MKEKDQIDPLKPTKEQIEAYIRLSKLDAAPAVSFNAHEDPDVYAQAASAVESEKYIEIIRNRKILGIGVEPEQVNVSVPSAFKKSEKKPAGKVLTTGSFNK